MKKEEQNRFSHKYFLSGILEFSRKCLIIHNGFVYE
jgi:hypothetical protein